MVASGPGLDAPYNAAGVIGKMTAYFLPDSPEAVNGMVVRELLAEAKLTDK